MGRALWAALGGGCVALGLVGVVVPGLPTTPFLILAAACFLRSSQSLYDRVLAHPRFGPLVRDFREGKGLPLRVKVWALSLMWLFVLFALGPGLPAGNLWLRALVAAAALIGSTYILSLPTRTTSEREGMEASSLAPAAAQLQGGAAREREPAAGPPA